MKTFLKTLAAGSLVKIVDDGGFFAGHGARFICPSLTSYTVKLMIKGKIYDISVERVANG